MAGGALSWRLLLALPLALLAGCVSAPAGEPKRVLIFSHTTGYRHESIPAGIAAVRALVERQGAAAIPSEDPAIFSDQGLAGLDAIVLLSSTTDPKKPESEWLAGPRRAALQRFVRSGGGIVAIHAAADSHYHWPWYGRMIGGRFERHPPGTPPGNLTVADPRHPATEHLPERFSRVDEWYFFRDFNREVRLLLTLDPTSIGEQDAAPRPISWAHRLEGGPVFYTGMGHTTESYGDPLFLRHLEGGLRWVLARARPVSRRSASAARP